MSAHWLRGFAVCAALLAASARADEVEDSWKNLVMQGLEAAGTNDFSKAETLLNKALHEAERFGPADARVGTTINSLGLVYKAEKKFGEAEGAFRKSVAILGTAFGDDSIDVANVNFNIGSVLMDESKHALAIEFLQKSLSSYQRLLGGESLKTAAVLCMMGDSYKALRSWKEAEAPLKRCAELREADGGILNKDLGEALNSLAIVYQFEGKYALADRTYKLAEKIREKTLGILSPEFAETLESHAAMLRQMGRTADADKDAALAAAIRRNEKKNK